MGGRQRFTLGHELGHLVMHNTIRFSYDEVEKQADRFASAFLMPEKQIKPKLRNLTIDRLIALSAEWRVSAQALIHRGYDLGTLTERQYREWNQLLSRGGYRSTELVPIPPERTTLLDTLIRAHKEELNYSNAELADALVMQEWEFKKNYLHRDEITILPAKAKRPVQLPAAE